MITLQSVYRTWGADQALYRLLQERPPEANISHRAMPTFAEHLAFVHSKPYLAWYMIMDGANMVGAIYLTKAREIGIFIFAQHQRCGYGRQAIAELAKHWPGKFYANVAPGNERSHDFFKSLGARLIELTYEL